MLTLLGFGRWSFNLKFLYKLYPNQLAFSSSEASSSDLMNLARMTSIEFWSRWYAMLVHECKYFWRVEAQLYSPIKLWSNTSHTYKPSPNLNPNYLNLNQIWNIKFRLFELFYPRKTFISYLLILLIISNKHVRIIQILFLKEKVI